MLKGEVMHQPIRPLFSVAAWIDRDGEAFWEYVKNPRSDEEFFDLPSAARFAKKVATRKGVVKVEVRMQVSVESFRGACQSADR